MRLGKSLVGDSKSEILSFILSRLPSCRRGDNLTPCSMAGRCSRRYCHVQRLRAPQSSARVPVSTMGSSRAATYRGDDEVRTRPRQAEL